MHRQHCALGVAKFAARIDPRPRTVGGEHENIPNGKGWLAIRMAKNQSQGWPQNLVLARGA